MELYQYSERIYYSAYEEERDRPALGYIKGDRFSIAVDAGHSDEHVNEFYEALKQEDLPLPELTILTHWHWDHSFALHQINGLSIACKRSDEHIKDFIANRSVENDAKFLKLDPSIEKEYENNKPLVVIRPDIVFEKNMKIDAGNLEVFAFEAVSPHTDDAVLIYVPEEKVLFFGDATSGVFPTWVADPSRLKAMIDTLESIDAKAYIGGHWPIFTKEKLLKQLYETLRQSGEIVTL